MPATARPMAATGIRPCAIPEARALAEQDTLQTLVETYVAREFCVLYESGA